MPGKKGVKLIARLSKTGKWNSVKELVFDLLEKNPNIRRQVVEKEVMKEYPNSNFVSKDGKKSHFPWYKHNFLKKKLEEERCAALREDEVKDHADQLQGRGDSRTISSEPITSSGHTKVSSKVSKNKKGGVRRKAGDVSSVKPPL